MNNEFTKWFLMCVQNKYADFNGRARRREYWMYVLVYVILYCIVALVEGFLGLSPFLTAILSLALLVPSLAVGVRRLHDVGKSGWWLLVVLVPILGSLYFLYLAVKDSQPDTNRWGTNPKAAEP